MSDEAPSTERRPSIAASVMTLEADNLALKNELAAFKEAADALPHVPPGFQDSLVARITWTAKWVKAHWADSIAADEARREAARMVGETQQLILDAETWKQRCKEKSDQLDKVKAALSS